LLVKLYVPSNVIELCKDEPNDLIQINQSMPSEGSLLVLIPDHHSLLKLPPLNVQYKFKFMITFSLRMLHLWTRKTFLLYFSISNSSFLD